MPYVLKVLVVVVLLIIGVLFLIDRVMLWMEARGWVYWRMSKPNMRSAGSAFLDLQTLVDPGKRYVVEARRQEEAAIEEEDSQGAGENPQGRGENTQGDKGSPRRN